MSNVNFFRGQNVKFKAYQSNRPVIFLAKNWDVEQSATECSDGVNGELRNRLDIVTNEYKATVDLFQNSQEVMNALIAQQEANDAQAYPLPQTCAIEIAMRDGTRAAYILQGCVWGPWKVNNSSRDENVMLNIGIRFQYWKPIQAI